MDDVHVVIEDDVIGERVAEYSRVDGQLVRILWMEATKENTHLDGRLPLCRDDVLPVQRQCVLPFKPPDLLQARDHSFDVLKINDAFSYSAVSNPWECSKHFTPWQTCSFLGPLNVSGRVQPHCNYCTKTICSHSNPSV